MIIEFYPTLEQALKALRKGEVLYTNSWFILNPIRIRYEKDTVWHKEGSVEYERTQYVPRVVEEERLTISDKLRLEAKKNPDSRGLAQERNLYVIEKGKKEKIEEDITKLYSFYCFRKEEIEELIEDLTSSSEKNKGVFKEPLRRAISLGLEEVKSKIKGKDFILVGIMSSWAYEKTKELGVLRHLAEYLKNPILMALEEDERKKDFSENFEEFWKTNFLDIVERVKDVVSEKIEYVNEIEKKKYGLHGNKESHFWHDVIEVVDKKLGLGKGRLVANVWEKDKILGMETGGISELEDHVYEAKKKLEKAGEEIFPEVLVSINMYLPIMPKPEDAEVLIIPSGIRDKNKRGDKEIDFLTLVKLKVEDKEFKCNRLLTYETKESLSIRANTQHYMKIVSKKEVPKELTEGKGKILVKPRYSEYIKIINSYASEKRGVETELKSMKKQALLEEVQYIAETEGLTKSIVIDVGSENQPPVLVKDYDEIKEGKSISEKIIVETFLSKSISPKIEKEEKEGAGCLGGEKVDRIIKEELEQLAEEIKGYVKGETKKEEKAALESASLVARRAAEVLGRGNISHSTCGEAYKKEAYRYEIYPKPTEGYKPIVEDKELVQTLRSCCNPLVIKKYQILFSLLNSKESVNLCFESEGVKARIRAEEIDKIIGGEGKKETVYIAKFSGELVNMFSDYVKKIISENPVPEYDHDDIYGIVGGGVKQLTKIPDSDEEVIEINNLSLLLSGIITSSILIPWEERFPLIKGKKEEEMNKTVGKLYKVILAMLTGGAYEYVERKENPWSKTQIFWVRKKGRTSMLNEKELLREMMGVVMKIKVSEGIEVSIPGYGGKKKSGQGKADLKTYYNIELPKWEKPITFYLETGKEDKVVKMEMYINTEYS